MANFLINTKAEFLKSRRTLAYRVAFIAGVAMPVLFMLGYILKPGAFSELKAQAWEAHMKNVWQFGAAFFPMYVTILASLVVQTEYRNNTWKMVYMQPRSHADIFFSKFMVIQLLLLASLLIHNLAILTTGYLANLFHSEYAFSRNAPPLEMMLRITVRMYIASLCITAIQYWFSLRFRNFITSMGLGIGLTIVAFIILQWDKVVYYPYAYPALTYFKAGQVNGLATHEWNSLAGAATALLLGFWNIARRKERG
ncbi:ABC transporter permease [Pseudoflavitalea rhizosphaerae]|uniref:ABC transporter permease n=1 Tax=Pseudoflavitalea rhizosphaerae TaxID=1884793 RepID=UPI000F8CF3C3|nr:ABC transporter permease [Pseudoflavitalea rhizosphaerae]